MVGTKLGTVTRRDFSFTHACASCNRPHVAACPGGPANTAGQVKTSAAFINHLFSGLERLPVAASQNQQVARGTHKGFSERRQRSQNHIYRSDSKPVRAGAVTLTDTYCSRIILVIIESFRETLRPLESGLGDMLFGCFLVGRGHLSVCQPRPIWFSRTAELTIGTQTISRNGHVPPVPGVKIIASCPWRAYEFETIILKVAVHRSAGAMRGPIPIEIETSDQVAVQGAKKREVAVSENWFLLPKEQGDYVVEVRSSKPLDAWQFHEGLPLRVYKFDHIRGRSYVAGTALSAILGAVGAFVLFWPKLFGKR